MKARAYQLTAGLTSGCPQTEVKDHLTSLEVICVSMLSPSAIVGFLDQDYGYKSEAIKSPHDNVLELVRVARNRNRDHYHYITHNHCIYTIKYTVPIY